MPLRELQLFAGNRLNFFLWKHSVVWRVRVTVLRVYRLLIQMYIFFSKGVSLSPS